MSNHLIGTKKFWYAIMLCATLALSACGGSGSGGGTLANQVSVALANADVATASDLLISDSADAQPATDYQEALDAYAQHM
ncbi:MAG: hypothetical protein ORN21_06855 [Methylophilaceae bacterium]|nr:hypothetical protein [Methylophilaceae bacterium]